MTPNQKAFLDTIAHSELGAQILVSSNNGYNVIVGSTASKLILFDSYADHPRKLVQIRPGLASTAAGRYQLLARYFDVYKRQLGLEDFSPHAQDMIALQQIKECRALNLIDAGNFNEAIEKCAHIWASLPGAGYGQHENKMDDLRLAYVRAGGIFA